MINYKPKIYTTLIFSSALGLSVVATAHKISSSNLSSGTEFGYPCWLAAW